MTDLTESSLLEALREIQRICDDTGKKLSIKPTKFSPNAEWYNSAYVVAMRKSNVKQNLSPVAVMGWVSDPPHADEDFPLNALGRNDDSDDWQPFHMRADLAHTDQNGVLIKPFSQVRKMSHANVKAWMEARGVVAVSLRGLGVP